MQTVLPTGLSMLWEPVDAPTALRERFGFADLADLTRWTTTTLAATWGLTVTAVPRVVISDRNAIAWAASTSGDLVTKWSCDASQFDRLDALAHLLRLLARCGVPVAEPVEALGGRARVVVPGPLGPVSASVLPHVEGDWLDTADLDAVRAAGAALAHTHAALADAPAELVAALSQLPGRGASNPRRGDVRGWLARHDRGLVPEASARLEALLDDLPELDDAPQLVHGDFRAANVLVRESEVVAVLDLDEASVRHRVDDLAQACTYLGTRFTGWAPTAPVAQRALVEGYSAVRPLDGLERRWFEALLLWHGITAVSEPGDPAGWAAAVTAG